VLGSGKGKTRPRLDPMARTGEENRERTTRTGQCPARVEQEIPEQDRDCVDGHEISTRKNEQLGGKIN
jgi:hypothetical protein